MEPSSSSARLHYHDEAGLGPMGGASLGPFGEYSTENASSDAFHDDAENLHDDAENLPASSVFVDAATEAFAAGGGFRYPSGAGLPANAIMPIVMSPARFTSSPTASITPAAVEAVAKSGVDAFIDPLGLLLEPTTHRLSQEIDAMALDEPILQGYLRKEGSSRLSASWKRRWFVLTRQRLQYYKKQDSEEAQGHIPVAAIVGIAMDTAQYPQPHAFQLLTAGRTYALQAPLDAAQRHWLSAIAATIYHRMHSNMIRTSPTSLHRGFMNPVGNDTTMTLSALADMDDEQRWASPAYEPESAPGNVTMAGDKLKMMMDEILKQSHEKDAKDEAQRTDVAKALQAVEQLAKALAGADKHGKVTEEGKKPPKVPGKLPDKHTVHPSDARSTHAKPPAKSAARPRSNSAYELGASTEKSSLLFENLSKFSELPDNVVVHVEVEESYGNKGAAKKVRTGKPAAEVTAPAPDRPRSLKVPPLAQSAAGHVSPDAPGETARHVKSSRSEMEEGSINGSRTTSRRGSTGAGSHISESAKPVGAGARASRFRLEYAKLWINSLGLGETLPIGAASKCAGHFRDGVLLCSLIEAADPSAHIDGINLKPRARAACMHNIEKALQVLWKARLKRSKIPSADDIYDAREDRITALLPELLDAFGIRQCRQHASVYLEWLQTTLSMFQLPLRVVSTDSCHWKGLADTLKDGTFFVLLAILYMEGFAAHWNPCAVWALPTSAAQRFGNWDAAVPTLLAAHVPLLAPSTLLVSTPDDWATEEDDDFALLQLQLLYDALHGRRFAIPFVDTPTSVIGIASVPGPAGRTQQRVVGVAFADTERYLAPSEPAKASELVPPPLAAAPAVHVTTAQNSNLKSDVAEAAVRESGPTASQTMATIPASPSFSEVLSERDRLYVTALGRAAGNRASSSAVHAVARQWADNKVAIWARTLRVSEDTIVAVQATRIGHSTTPSPTAVRLHSPSARAAPTRLLSPDASFVPVHPTRSVSEMAAVEKACMAREEKRSWELFRQQSAAKLQGASPMIPPRGGLFAVSLRTQPLTFSDVSNAGPAIRPKPAPMFDELTMNTDRTVAVEASRSASPTQMFPLPQVAAVPDIASKPLSGVDGTRTPSSRSSLSAPPANEVEGHSSDMNTFVDDGARATAKVGMKVRALVREIKVFMERAQPSRLSWGIAGKEEGSVTADDVTAAAVKVVDGVRTLSIRITPHNIQAVRRAAGLLLLEFLPASGSAADVSAFDSMADVIVGEMTLKPRSAGLPSMSADVTPKPALRADRPGPSSQASAAMSTAAADVTRSTALETAPEMPLLTTQPQPIAPSLLSPFPIQPRTTAPSALSTISPFPTQQQTAIPAPSLLSPFPTQQHTTCDAPPVKFELRGLQPRTQGSGMLASFLASRKK